MASATNPSSGWVLLVGILWIVVMTAICYVGIEISANIQKVLLGIELTMLLVFSVVALVKVGIGTRASRAPDAGVEWFNPFYRLEPTSFMVGFTLMLFIYWGWDTAVSVNEETKDSTRTPGRAAVLSTVILLATYALVIMASQSYAGIGTTGIGLGNPANPVTCINVLGASVFGTSGIGSFMTNLLLLMVLSSAAASTQTTILPTARTTLSMAAYKAIPSAFGRVHKRFLTPTVSTVAMGARVHRAVRGDELPLEREQRHRRLGVGPWGHDRLLLRPDRVRLCLVLPQEPDRERPNSVAARHPPAARVA